jgi:site-specific recombinase XerD
MSVWHGLATAGGRETPFSLLSTLTRQCRTGAVWPWFTKNDNEPFFLANNGTSLNVSTVKYIVAKYVKKAGIRKKASVHTLRHTFGAHKADKHMSLATLQQLMGHKKKETTLKYIHLAKTNLRAEMVETAL